MNRFVGHVALLANDIDLAYNEQPQVFHIMPPIGASVCHAHMVGDIGLKVDDQNKIETWISLVDTEYQQASPGPSGVPRFQQYSIVPHCSEVKNERGVVERRRFSCVGYVHEAYRFAGILLVDTDALPEVSPEIAIAAYPQLARIESREPETQQAIGFRGRADLGLTGDGPWKIYLPGYVFHSASRATVEKPRNESYRPTSSEDGFFPH